MSENKSTNRDMADDYKLEIREEISKQPWYVMASNLVKYEIAECGNIMCMAYEPDPWGAFKGVYTDHQVRELVGFIPDFIATALNECDGDESLTFLDRFCAAYGFGAFEMSSGKMNKRGILVYDNGTEEEDCDPPLPPVAFIVCKAGIVFIYEYGVVSVIDFESGQGPFVTRMD